MSAPGTTDSSDLCWEDPTTCEEQPGCQHRRRSLSDERHEVGQISVRPRATRFDADDGRYARARIGITRARMYATQVAIARSRKVISADDHSLRAR